jgi:hypothetical protein
MQVSFLVSAASRELVDHIEQRLPPQVRRWFADVSVIEDARCPSLADAGLRDIRIQPGLVCSTPAAIAVLVHEMGHVAGTHVRRVARGEITPVEAEAEADRYAQSWGFGRELAARRQWFGR